MQTKWMLMCAVLLTTVAQAVTNVAPVVTISSAAMRPGTTLMDVIYRITDPDDATVKVRALAFTNGVRSFANVIRPTTFVEGTATNLGDAITTGVDHKLTWDVRSDWNIDLAQVKFEVLARDTRELLTLNWITIPATTNSATLTISLNVPTDAQVLDALFWLYAIADANLVLTDGALKGTSGSGMFSGEVLATGEVLQSDTSRIFLYKIMNLSRATFVEKDFAISARTGLSDRTALYAVNRPWNESVLGVDHTAVTNVVVSGRWVKHSYIDGAITMSDRFNGLMWVYHAGITGGTWPEVITIANDLIYAGHDDWYLPNSATMSTMSPQRGYFVTEGGDTVYWTSDDGSGVDLAYGVRIVTGLVRSMYRSLWLRIWPVRDGD